MLLKSSILVLMLATPSCEPATVKETRKYVTAQQELSSGEQFNRISHCLITYNVPDWVWTVEIDGTLSTPIPEDRQLVLMQPCDCRVKHRLIKLKANFREEVVRIPLVPCN